jgi:hypothetical protein
MVLWISAQVARSSRYSASRTCRSLLLKSLDANFLAMTAKNLALEPQLVNFFFQYRGTIRVLRRTAKETS